MAIRPTDIQGAIWQAVQTAPLNQRAQEAPREAQAAAQAAFAAQLAERQETVDETAESLGNRVDANADREARGEAHERDGKRRNAFEDVVDEAAGFDEPRHLIDFTA
ncbi:MAG: hypothetical protein JWN27_4471 [Candidatus Eremiobacteraeota bacterium]|nr:hypothetical protein [Candidatus Eremiobacteraeota bacterium]